MSDMLLSVHDLHNYEVYDPQGNKLGVLEDFMLDLKDSSVRYAILATSTLGAVKKKVFAVPLAALTLDTENECFVLAIAQERLESAKGFDAKTTPKQPDPLFAKQSPRH